MFMIEFGHTISLNTLKNLKKEVKLKQNILTLSQLENIRDYGCRILVLFSSMIDVDNNLIMEGANGLVKKLSSCELTEILRPIEKNAKLNVDVVFVNIINGTKIANVFKKLGAV